jgi:putative phosphoribosyl transferase
VVLYNSEQEALEKLVDVMPIQNMKKEKWTVLAISEGGVFFAKHLSRLLNTGFDFLFTEKITAPNNEECVIASISETEEIVINENLINSFDITLDYVYGEAGRVYDEKILKYMYKYRKGELVVDLKDKNILLVDEGADTGMTLMVSLKSVLSADVAKVAVACPILPKSIADELLNIVNEVYVVNKIKNYVNLKSYFKKNKNKEKTCKNTKK